MARILIFAQCKYRWNVQREVLGDVRGWVVGMFLRIRMHKRRNVYQLRWYSHLLWQHMY